MKTLICLLLLFSSPIIIKLDYYKGEGVIFPKEYRNYNLGSPMPTFTPSINQIIRAEKIMHENYHNYEMMIIDSLKLTGESDLKSSNPKTFISHFRNYNRQYSGYIDENKDSIIFIGLLNFKNKKRIKPYFDNWKEEIFLCSGSFCQKNFRLCKVNLTTCKVVGI
jgi:hypothetical protein